MISQLLPGGIAAGAVFNCRVWPEPEPKPEAASVSDEGVRGSGWEEEGLSTGQLVF